MSPCCRLAILRAMGYHIGNGSRVPAELAGAFLLPIAHLTSVTIYNHFKAIVTEMGLPEVRFHDLRHPDVKQATKNNEYLIEFLKIMRIDTLLQVHYSPFLSAKASWRVVSISIRLS